MRSFINLLKWDIVLLIKYGILPVAIGIGVLYIALIYLLNIPSDIIILLIFSDPSMMGFIFVGVMVLFEKQAGTTNAIIVTPLQPWQYLLSKSISLTIPAVIVSIAMGLASKVPVNYFFLIIAIALTSILFLLIGFVGAQRVKTFNQYILIIPMFLAPLCIPIVDFFGLWETPLMWLIPTHASLELLNAAFNEVKLWKIFLSHFVLLLSILLAWKWAIVEYRKSMSE
jgi:fluoroquinolone transport system permease protein